jgi:hypothetical protein
MSVSMMTGCGPAVCCPISGRVIPVIPIATPNATKAHANPLENFMATWYLVGLSQAFHLRKARTIP